jgi:hypothetical protein
LEKQYLAKARERQKQNLVKPQVVAGREFKGIAFISKPDQIFFKVNLFFSTFDSTFRFFESCNPQINISVGF